MDITRNWRLKSTRSQLLATRCPTTGEVRLPQQTASLAVDVEPYVFESDARESVLVDSMGGYAKAAR